MATAYSGTTKVILSGWGQNGSTTTDHMGGMVWYQDKLIVTSWEADADHNVMYIFDMNRVPRRPSTAPRSAR